MTNLPVSKEVYEAIKAGFALSEREVYALNCTKKTLKKYMKEYMKIPVVAAHPEAFLDGVALRRCVCFIFSADTTTDYENDVAFYDAEAEQMNKKYGNIVLTAAQVEEAPGQAYGLIGSRAVPFARVTTTEFPSGKTTVKLPRAEVEAADEELSSELKFAENS